MGLSDKRREADELVEPLFAGLSGAQERKEAGAGEADAGDAPPDPWKHPRAAQAQGASPTADDIEGEPSTFPLLLKALLLLIVLVAIGAFVYLTIGV